MSTFIWPSKPLPVEQVKPYLPENFGELSPEMQDHAYLLADWRAKNPGKDLETEFKRELRVLGYVLVAFIALGVVLFLLAGCAAPPGAVGSTICRPAGVTGDVTICDGPVKAGMVCAPAGRTGRVTTCR